MCCLKPTKVEVALVALASCASFVGWALRPEGDQVICLRNTVLNELKKTGLKDPQVLEELAKEFFQLSDAMPGAPLDNVFWNITVPLYHIRYYLSERNALKVVVKKANDIVQAESRLKTTE